MSSHRVVVVGAGYVGLTTGACLASLGHQVVCVDTDAAKVAALSAGRVDIFEPQLTELVADGLSGTRLRFVTDVSSVDIQPDVVLLCLPTPMSADGRADVSQLESVAVGLRDTLPRDCAVVIKSTVPVGTAARLAELIGRPDVAVVSNPEFLREGSAVRDFLRPERIVIGSDDRAAAERVAGLYAAVDAPVVVTDVASAELAKYAANCFLAMKLSYVNEIADLCDRLGADVTAVTATMGHDSRIGAAFLRPGPGWGGPCLPKDTAAMLYSARSSGVDLSLVRAAVDDNARRSGRVADRVRGALGGRLDGARIGVYGLAFKAGTNDLRGSPALAVAGLLAGAGAELVGYDPSVPQDVPGVTDMLTVCADPYQAAKGADAVVLLTEWPLFRALDWSMVAELMSGSTIVDTRNHLDADLLASAGLVCRSTGRPGAGVRRERSR